MRHFPCLIIHHVTAEAIRSLPSPTNAAGQGIGAGGVDRLNPSYEMALILTFS